MKKIFSKSVVSVLAISAVVGVVGPMSASADLLRTGSQKVVIRDDEHRGILQLSKEIKGETTYIKGKVAENVSKIEILAPDGRKIEVLQFTNQEFEAGLPSIVSATPQYIIVKAYTANSSTPLDTKKLLVNHGTVQANEYIKLAVGQFDSSKDKVVIKGLADHSVDSLVVVYDGEKQEVKSDSLWNKKGSFEVTFAEVADKPAKATVEAYKDGEKVDSKEILVKDVTKSIPAVWTYRITGKATISANTKQVIVHGKIEITNSNQSKVDTKKLKLYVTSLDGHKYEVKLKDDYTFEVKLPFANRSFLSKAVHVEVYSEKTLVVQTNIAAVVLNTKPVVTPPKQLPPVPAAIKKDRDKAEKNHGKGQEKQKEKGHDHHDKNRGHERHDD